MRDDPIGRWLFFALLAVACAVAGALRAETQADLTPAGAALRAAYGAVVEAELALAEGRTAAATNAYGRAIELYTQLQKQYPGWQQAIVDYRLADCQNQLAALERAPDGVATGAPAAQAAGTDPRAVRLARLADELRATWALIAPETREAFRRERLATERAERELAVLRLERDEAVRKNQELTRRLARLEERGRQQGGVTAAPGPRLLPSVVKLEARRLLESGETEAAVTLLEEANRLLPDEQELAVQLAMAYCHAGRFAEAAPRLKALIKQGVRNTAVWLTLGTACMGLGELGEARVATEEALRLAPDSAPAHYNLAQILLGLQPPDIAGAEQHYARALSLGTPPDAAFEERLRLAVLEVNLPKLRKR